MMRNDVWLYIADIVYYAAPMFFGTYGEYVPKDIAKGKFLSYNYLLHSSICGDQTGDLPANQY